MVVDVSLWMWQWSLLLDFMLSCVLSGFIDLAIDNVDVVDGMERYTYYCGNVKQTFP